MHMHEMEKFVQIYIYIVIYTCIYILFISVYCSMLNIDTLQVGHCQSPSRTCPPGPPAPPAPRGGAPPSPIHRRHKFSALQCVAMYYSVLQYDAPPIPVDSWDHFCVHIYMYIYTYIYICVRMCVQYCRLRTYKIQHCRLRTYTYLSACVCVCMHI